MTLLSTLIGMALLLLMTHVGDRFIVRCLLQTEQLARQVQVNHKVLVE